MKFQRTLVLIKPKAVCRGLIGKIIARYEDKGFNIAALKLLHMTRQQAEKLYEVHKGKSFYESTIESMIISPIIAIVLAGFDAIEHIRNLNGSTHPLKASPGTIRGDFAMRIERNCVHSSDSKENAEREIAIFFEEDEILNYKNSAQAWEDQLPAPVMTE
jgi:nucleoside-diphosphate kinase